MSTTFIHKGRAYTVDDVPDEIADELIQLLENRRARYTKPPLSAVHSLDDFEPIAQKTLTKKAWAYYRTGCADEVTLAENKDAFRRMFLKPRVLRDVSKVDFLTTILGTSVLLPVYISAFAHSVWGHELAEKNFTWAAAETNTVQMIPSMAGFPIPEILAEAKPGQTQWLQIYTSSLRSETETLLHQAKAAGNVLTIVWTVDTAQLGKREYEQRLMGTSFDTIIANDPSFNWEDVTKYKRETGFKFLLKGIQNVDDAVLAAQSGVDGIIVSNHGGRQLDTARSSIEVLAEIVPVLKQKGLYNNIEIFLDGGVRRGTDVIKAIALGARAVGLGRPFLYSASVYGKDGVVKAIDLLKAEIELAMRLLGVTELSQLYEGLVDVKKL